MPRDSSFPSGPRIVGFRSASVEVFSRRGSPTIQTTFRRRKVSRSPSPTSRSRTRPSPATGPWSPEGRTSSPQERSPACSSQTGLNSNDPLGNSCRRSERFGRPWAPRRSSPSLAWRCRRISRSSCTPGSTRSTRVGCVSIARAVCSTRRTEGSPSRKQTPTRAAVRRAPPVRILQRTTTVPYSARCCSAGVIWSPADGGSPASANPSAVHEVIVTSPLGLIPRELERFYPAAAYDIPVTGDWSRAEAAMVTEALRAFLAANRYETVVAPLAAEAPTVKAAVPEAIPTSKERPTSDESLASLADTLNHVTRSAPHVPKGLRFSEEMSNIARFQFGKAGLGLVRGATFRGRMPDVRVIPEGTQVALHTGRGMLSLTLDGGAILSAADAYWVEIEDFRPKGNIFAVGVVEAAREIRPGDEVVVRHRKDVRAVGTARLSAREMVDFRRGEAVHVRHVIETPP